MNGHILFIGGMLMAVSTPLFAANSHCTATEETVYSCNLGRKVVSVCASKPLTAQSGYLQYRFGALGKPELTFPKTNVAPKTVVQSKSLMFSGGGGAYLRFTNGATSYVVYTAIGKGWGEKDGIAVQQKGKTTAHLECKDVPVSVMGDEFFTRAGLPEDPQEFDLP